MNRSELQILSWLVTDQRPVSNLVAMPADTLTAWIRTHGGKATHLDAAIGIRNALATRIAIRIEDANLAYDNVRPMPLRSANGRR